MQSSVSSKTGSQYLVLCTPSAYAFANLLSVCSAMMATENCVMGCVCFGSGASTSKTCWDVRARPELRGQTLHLRLRGDVPGEQEPQQALGEGLVDGGREPFLQVGDGVSTKPDALLRVQQRGLPDHAGDAAHAAHRHVHGDLAEGLVAVRLLDLLQALLLRGDGRGERLLDLPPEGEAYHLPGPRRKVAVGAAVVDAWAVRPETATMRRMALVDDMVRSARRAEGRARGCGACASVDRRYFPKVRFWLFRTCRRRSGCQRKKCFSDPRENLRA